MPAWMTIDNDSTPDRLAVALSYIKEGRSVSFPGFSLAICDGLLHVDIDNSSMVPDDEAARRSIAFGLNNLDSLLSSHRSYHTALSTLPRRVALTWSNGMGDVEVAKVVAEQVLWNIVDS